MRFDRILSTVGVALVAAQQANEVPDASLSLPTQFDGPAGQFDTNGAVTFAQNQIKLTALDVPNQHGALWTKRKNSHQEWTMEVQMSISGPDSAGGGLAMWYAANPNQGGPVHGSRDYWDGLGIFLDSDAANGEGTIRGHLNDGSIGYKTLKSPAGNAFSLCKISYRNTGAQFTLRVGYGKNSLIVDVNGQKCFETDAVSLPKDLFFGVSAASTQHPDSFLIHKFNVYPKLADSLAIHRPGAAAKGAQPPPPPPAQQQQPQQQQQQQQQPRDTNAMSQQQASEILQKLDATYQRLNGLDQVQASVNDLANVRTQLSGLESRLDRLEKLFQDVRGGSPQLSQEMQNLKSQIDRISTTVHEHTSSVLGTLPETVNQAIANGGPSIWILFALVIVVQGVLVVGYNVYKTRRSYHAKIL